MNMTVCKKKDLPKHVCPEGLTVGCRMAVLNQLNFINIPKVDPVYSILNLGMICRIQVLFAHAGKVIAAGKSVAVLQPGGISPFRWYKR